MFGLNSPRRSTRKRGSDSEVKLSVRVLRSSSTLSPGGTAPKRVPLFTKIKRDCARSYEGKNMNHVSFGAGAPRMFRSWRSGARTRIRRWLHIQVAASHTQRQLSVPRARTHAYVHWQTRAHTRAHGNTQLFRLSRLSQCLES